MKPIVAIATMILLLSSIAWTQTTAGRGLVLTGSLLGVTEGFAYEMDSDGQMRSKRRENVVEISLLLQYRNNSDGPLIIMLPHDLRRGVSFLEPSGSVAEEAHALVPIAAASNYDPCGRLLLSLGASGPSKNFFIVLEPGAYYEFRDTITVGLGYKVVERDGQEKSPSKRIISKYPALKVRYDLPVNDRPDVRDALSSAKRRWAGYGELMLNSKDTFDHTSESILNRTAE